MKVLLTATVQSHIAQFHRVLADMLHKNGFEVHVAAKDNLASKNGLVLDFADKIFDVPFSRSPKSLDNIKAYKQLKKIIQENDYDIIHCNTPMGGIVTRLAARKARKTGTKVFYTAHGFHFYKGASWKNWMLYYPIEKLFSKITDKLITINKEDFYFAKEKFYCDVLYMHGVGANTEKFCIKSPGEKQILRAEMGISENTKIIVNVGELLPNKNQKTAICAMSYILKKFPDSKMFIAGNGKERSHLEKLIAEKDLVDNIILVGYTTELERYLNVADVLISCSFREGLPVNVMEAMLCGVPVVASINRGHKELVKSGENGFLVETQDYEAFAERICYILESAGIERKNVLESVQPFADVSVYEEIKKIYFEKGE